MVDKTTLSAQVDRDSELFEDFLGYEEEFESRSEAVRTALRDGITDDEITRSEFEAAMERQHDQFRLGAWESAVLHSSALLATLSIVVAVLTITPLVPSFEGIVGAALLVGAAGVLAALVQRGFVARIQDSLGTSADVEVPVRESDEGNAITEVAN